MHHRQDTAAVSLQQNLQALWQTQFNYKELRNYYLTLILLEMIFSSVALLLSMNGPF